MSQHYRLSSSVSPEVSGSPPETNWNDMYTDEETYSMDTNITSASSSSSQDLTSLIAASGAFERTGNQLLPRWDAFWLQARVSNRYFYNALESSQGISTWVVVKGLNRDWTRAQHNWFTFFVESIHALTRMGRDLTTNEVMHVLQRDLLITNIIMVHVSPACYFLYPTGDSLPQWNRDDFSAAEQAYISQWAPGVFWPNTKVSAATEDGEWDELSRFISETVESQRAPRLW